MGQEGTIISARSYNPAALASIPDGVLMISLSCTGVQMYWPVWGGVGWGGGFTF